MNVTVELVEALGPAMAIRKLRNECREFMTGNTDLISFDQQKAFFHERIATGEVKALLFREDSRPVAYALLFPDKEHDDRGWLSAGVTETARGKGYGKRAIQAITLWGYDRYGKVLGEARADNVASISACVKVGYRVSAAYYKDGTPMILLEYP